jgi:NitT/TauT family transport system substrate-binding protein
VIVKRLIPLLLIMIVLCFGGASAQDNLTEVQFFMTFVPNIQFAPVYVAIEKGYFAENGIALTIEHGDEPVGVDLIAAGQRQFGLISGEQVIAARANGRPVVSVYEWFQRYPIGIVAGEEAGISTPADLAGRNVGIPGRFGASYAGLLALLDAVGLSESDIELEEIGFNAPEVICVGGVEAAVVYINNEPVQIDQRARQSDCGDISGVSVIPVGEYVDMVSNGIVTNEETIASNPELVRGMVAAFDAGLRSVINNPAEAYLISAAYVENLPLSRDLRNQLRGASDQQDDTLAETPSLTREELAAYRDFLMVSMEQAFALEELTQLNVLMETIPLWDADRLGEATLESWEMTQDVLLGMGTISEAQDVSAAFTNAFLGD